MTFDGLDSATAVKRNLEMFNNKLRENLVVLWKFLKVFGATTSLSGQIRTFPSEAPAALCWQRAQSQ